MHETELLYHAYRLQVMTDRCQNPICLADLADRDEIHVANTGSTQFRHKPENELNSGALPGEVVSEHNSKQV